ncbi:CPP1-like family protein [Oscillatoriales cyanobacterium LEGE 11467]|uniref:CPP1-like family protein n=1 Tax=Zarconia navalis LEGE 11467 TaxID=1828826 RepID=A0A928VZ42_9CYAN|nr:CPP1-like family protein [Zarconia navalis]MBE9041492.1 CPP1-like family protein [Zarconia navalis LEGE 11467]
MSDRSPYEQLGVSEDSSFDEIQAARSRLLEENAGDRKLSEKIEMAYDALLMERLRMRQEGKIKVPERIRFPERLTPEAPPNKTSSPIDRTPAWLQSTLDTPSQSDILWPAGIMLALSALSIGANFAPVALALGVGTSLYFLNRKEKRFGRALLLTVATLLVGLLAGGALASSIAPQLGIVVDVNTLTAWITFFLLWLTTSFLK